MNIEIKHPGEKSSDNSYSIVKKETEISNNGHDAAVLIDENPETDSNLYVNVYNDNILVYTGSINCFFEDNQYDEDVIFYCKDLTDGNTDVVEFLEFSGHWKVEKIS